MLTKHTCYKVAAELCKAAQLYVFILGRRYLGLGVLRLVFGVRYAVSVLVTHHRFDEFELEFLVLDVRRVDADLYCDRVKAA